MPLLRDPVNTNVRIEWEGPAVTRRIRRGLRAAMVKQATAAQELSRVLVNKDTLALKDAIIFRIRRGRQGVYSLEFGVFDDAGNRPRVTYYVSGYLYSISAESALMLNAADGQGQGVRIEQPEDYAFWQETDPQTGSPYIRPAVDAYFSPSVFWLAVADEVFYQRSGYGDDPNFDLDVSIDRSGFDQ